MDLNYRKYSMDTDLCRGKRVILNVGGKRFETLVETLRKYPNTMLGAMFHSRMAQADEHGEFFFDRDPKIFPVVLNFYRHGKILVPTNLSQEMVKEELEFFGINMDDPLEGLGDELRREADFVSQKRLCQFIDDFMMPKMKVIAQQGHYTFEVGLVPERHSMNNMTNMPSLIKNSDYYDLFSERENRRRMTKMLRQIRVCSQWDRSEQVHVSTKEFLFECFKLTVWWNEEPAKQETAGQDPVSSTGMIQHRLETSASV